ncbi:uncharacterized protein CLUP02_16090 [Colletotrichum lupini]|uniref:Uncharacterized protein n=1 Tax=Colletotrichum lupini TaxID=145971 RepID=A0A9Q8WPU0_9PEZI|nr:uncharacterized protein CLUP02_16090 [Colletotrichum lupini]UQC90560.1 hypothetical protein CLUP02_16090 [Colletotrichum lupini]
MAPGLGEEIGLHTYFPFFRSVVTYSASQDGSGIEENQDCVVDGGDILRENSIHRPACQSATNLPSLARHLSKHLALRDVDHKTQATSQDSLN